MSTNTPPSPSKRFVRAAQAERTALLRAHARLAAKRDRLTMLLEAASGEMDTIESRLSTLAQLVGDPDLARIPIEGRAANRPDPQNPDGRIISGPAIRHTAVRILLDQPQPFSPIHYSDWHELLARAGYIVGGKSPKAVFLTQISRSPVVTKLAEPGVYALDAESVRRLRERLKSLQGELHEIACLPLDQFRVLGGAATHRQLTTAINRVERDLTEANALLPGSDPVHLLDAA